MHGTLVYIQPILTDAVEILAAIIMALLAPKVPAIAASIANLLHLNSNDKARLAIAQAMYDGGHLLDQVAEDAVTHVGPIDAGDPKVAFIANYAITHAPDELAHLGYDKAKVVSMAASAVAQITADKTATPPAAPASPEKTS